MPLSRSLNGDFDFSQLKQNWMGEWNEGVIYKLNDTVRLNGKAFVMNSTFHAENNLFGQEVKPGVDTTNWTMVLSGSVFKGDWSLFDRHYRGDIVRYNEDFYQCVADNYNGHPIYENGAVSTKWQLIAKTSRADKHKVHLTFQNFPPIGWTRNMGETSEMYGGSGNVNFTTINGNYEQIFIGRDFSCEGHGLGERVNTFGNQTFDGYGNVTGGSASGAQQYARNGGFDMYDYIDGVRTPITGQAPRIIQVAGNDTHTLVLFDTGELYHAGSNGQGGKGDGTTTGRRYFKRVGRSGARGTGVLRNERIIKCGTNVKSGNQTELDSHGCFALTDTGAVWMWGWNNYGQLGDGTRTDKNTPTLIPAGYFHNKKIIDMWHGGGNYASTWAQTEDGDLYSWGYNGTGQLGQGHFRDSARPERVKYNWKRYGGIKKFIHSGYGSETVAMVLTNDGQLHMCGNVGDASHPIYGAGTTVNTHLHSFQPAAQLFYARTNSLGIGNKRSEQGNMIDVMRNVDNFWLFSYGGSQFSLCMKERGTGIMYFVGIQPNCWPTYHRTLNRDEYSGDNPIHLPSLSFPAPLVMGNKTDIKYVSRAGNDSNMTVMFLNSDGTMWTNGSGSAFYTRGIGNPNSVADPTAQFVRHSGVRLPWEHYVRSHTPVQPRIHEKVNMLASTSQDSGAAFAVITSNGRFLVAGGVFSAGFALDPANMLSETWANGNYARIEW
jgi:alpha-tubulin suppressor-like RCC1 family protein